MKLNTLFDKTGSMDDIGRLQITTFSMMSMIIAPIGEKKRNSNFFPVQKNPIFMLSIIRLFLSVMTLVTFPCSSPFKD